MKAHAAVATLLVVLVAGCPKDPVTTLTRAELLDPATCTECHADHVREWSGSMHAYASTDPVFLAMNARGQRETNGELGDFCVKCHAPMALAEGATTDGLNLPKLPQHLQGVTCYFCHNVESVAGLHNNPLELANDTTMRGAISDPVANNVHRSAYSPLVDGEALESSDLCGSCHDIVTDQGVHLERTYHEWKESLFASESSGHLTCAECHMNGRNGLAADAPGVGIRRVHDHSMPGVDIALTSFPEIETQREQVEASLDTSLAAQLCVTLAGNLWADIQLDNVAVGHGWPSGASHDRRAWVEVVGYAGEDIVYESGRVEDGVALKEVANPDLWYFHDDVFDEDGTPAHMFWEISRFVTHQIPAPKSQTDQNSHLQRTYRIPPNADRVTMRVRIRPMGLDVIDDLIESKDLDAGIRQQIPTFTLASTALEWTLEMRDACVRVPKQRQGNL
jgi:hypothetical protein